jgi:hypothetical protein
MNGDDFVITTASTPTPKKRLLVLAIVGSGAGDAPRSLQNNR